jgi:peptide/nickel transport system substrate-binding protein
MVRPKILSVLVIGMLAFTACSSPTATQTPTAAASGGASASATAPASGAPATAEATALNGGSLVVADAADLSFADPMLVGSNVDLHVDGQVVEGLVGLKQGSTTDVVPLLASSLPTVSADGLTITFTVRTGVKFHDGTDFNAAAVKFNYDRWTNFPKGDLQDNAVSYSSIFGGFGSASNIVSVDAPNATTVVFHLQHPQPNFLISQAIKAFGIQSPAALQAGKADTVPLKDNKYAQGQLPQGQDMVGTGPFIFKEWVPGDHATLVKNPNYWDTAHVAHLDQITFLPIADATARMQALQSGTVDAVVQLQPADVATAQSSGMTIVDRGAPCSLGYLGLNQMVGGKPTIWTNKDLRLAVASAVNKPSYATAFVGPSAVVPDSWTPPGSIGYKAENLPTYDAAKAKQLFQQSGVPASQLAIDLWYPSNTSRPYMPNPKGLAQAISTDLQAVGFTVSLKSEDWSSGYVSDAVAGKLSMYVLGQNCDWAGADDFINIDFFGYANGQPNPLFAYKNDAMNQLMGQAMQAPSTDQANVMWGQVQDMLAADMPMIPLVSAAPPGAHSPKVQGYVGQAGMMEQYNTVWLSH